MATIELDTYQITINVPCDLVLTSEARQELRRKIWATLDEFLPEIGAHITASVPELNGKKITPGLASK